MTDSLAERTVSANAVTTACPHCKKPFEAAVDRGQPLRLQGAKCSHCRLFVPARHIKAQLAKADQAAGVAANASRTGDSRGGAISSTAGSFRSPR